MGGGDTDWERVYENKRRRAARERSISETEFECIVKRGRGASATLKKMPGEALERRLHEVMRGLIENAHDGGSSSVAISLKRK